MIVTQKQKKKVKELAIKHDLRLVMVFGSFATGKNREDSDLDIAILGNDDVDFGDLGKISMELSVIFSVDVDLSIMNHTNPLHLYQASKNAQLLYGTRRNFFNFKLNAFHVYNDYLPYFRLEAIYNKKIIKQYASR